MFQDTTSPDYESLYRELELEHKKEKKTMEERTKKLESELRDARDSAELLEFRLLELEQRESRERSPGVIRKQESDTSQECQDDKVSLGDSGCAGSLASLDDLLDTQTDFRVSDINAGNYNYHNNLLMLF